MNKINVFKRTSDDWYPSYKLDGDLAELVEVTFTATGPIHQPSGEWRVCVWGADDCGMEKDFDNKEEAFDCFLEVIALNDVKRRVLLDFGFFSA